MFLLDTNVLSELRKLGVGNADAPDVAWVSGCDAGQGKRLRLRRSEPPSEKPSHTSRVM